MPNYITPTELRAIADGCEALQPLWDLLTGGPKDGVAFEDFGSPKVYCYDANGETLGYISWGDEAAVFYADSTDPERPEDE
jgi:hypothetical protein